MNKRMSVLPLAVALLLIAADRGAAQSDDVDFIAVAVDTIYGLTPKHPLLLTFRPENESLVRAVADKLQVPARPQAEVWSCRTEVQPTRCWLNVPFQMSFGAHGTYDGEAYVEVGYRMHRNEFTSPGTAFTVFLQKDRNAWKVTRVRGDFEID